ncbi:major capsid protein P2 [Litoribrevibacter euphylliae]|uniref:Major capsid protein P2 n=1 Tax=Litoribrevibacter euphylliae TaxID=1834034 RepID=A0ABV7HGQ7_9GAMM
MSIRQIIKKANSFTGVANDSQATLKIDGGPTIDEIIIDTNGTITDSSKIKLVSLVLNGEEIVRATGAQLKMLENYKKLSADNDKFVIPFSDITANTLEGQQITGLVTFPHDNVILNVELGDISPAAPQIKAHLKVSPSTPVRTFLPMIRQITFTPDATGENDFTTLLRGPAYRRIHLKGDVAGMRIVKDGIEYMNTTKGVNDLLLRRSGLTPQSGYFHIDFIKSHWNKVDMFRTDDVVESLAIKPDVNTVAAMTMLVESLTMFKTPEKRLV